MRGKGRGKGMGSLLGELDRTTGAGDPDPQAIGRAAHSVESASLNVGVPCWRSWSWRWNGEALRAEYGRLRPRLEAFRANGP